MNTNDEYYETSDLSLATALSLFQRVEKVDNTNPMRVIFCFKKSPELMVSVSSYWSGEVRVDPLAFFNQMKAIKTRIYSKN
ncbi:hypothetical protein A2572_02500 [Candidatus Collierbacteria bacterium RIFOXYD1_FULL_40_9]|uniref:DUF5659 domain-containing protein n=1 Tax=Candidatus Collierbacteria bacterium RIFOXYD1_FULL_40_9 TaxID=1817731 RepID=A0A1F5FPE1_9BACT|nr:MAG: hypothetical protein A2572_02500 [Candidatus Collierbacteria bacterium RIFOXYD1_FULL_40_9]